MRTQLLAFLSLFRNLVFLTAVLNVPQIAGLARAQVKNVAVSAENPEKIILDRSDDFQETTTIDPDVWSSVLENYRSGHQLQILAGKVTGNWLIEKAGSLNNIDKASSGSVFEISYTYQLKLFDYFGYFVGSSFEAFYSSLSEQRGFTEGSSFKVPSLTVGLNLNPHWKYQIFAGFDYSIERVSLLKYKDVAADVEVEREVGIDLEGAQIFFGGTYFYGTRSAVFFKFVNSEQSYGKPDNLGDLDEHPLNISLSRQQQKFMIGYSYHYF